MVSRSSKRVLVLGVVWSFAVLVPLASLAQTPEGLRAVGGVQLNVWYPGARSLGLGGAFLGLADDATAAYTNPAGLTRLSKPEISLELRRWQYDIPYLDSGHFGTPTNSGVDSVAGLQEGRASSTTSSVSFLSIVYPHRNWAVAVYRQQLTSFETNFRTSGPFFDYVFEDETYSFRADPSSVDLDVEIVNQGVSFGVELGEHIALGLGVAWSDLDMRSRTNQYWNYWPADDTGPGGPYGPAVYEDQYLDYYYQQSGGETDVVANAGILVKLSSRMTLGLSYRQGPEFTVHQLAVSDFHNLSCGEYPDPNDCPVFPLDHIFFNGDVSFKVPDAYGLGVAFALGEGATLVLDYQHVEYSDMLDRTPSVFGTWDYLAVDDADELHAGFEYVVARNAKVPVALRVGSWYDPDHSIRLDCPEEGCQPFELAQYPTGNEIWHYSAGFGLIFGEVFAVDAAADLSDTVDTYSLSAVIRF